MPPVESCQTGSAAYLFVYSVSDRSLSIPAKLDRAVEIFRGATQNSAKPADCADNNTWYCRFLRCPDQRNPLNPTLIGRVREAE